MLHGKLFFIVWHWIGNVKIKQMNIQKVKEPLEKKALQEKLLVRKTS